jgi:predicted nucleic acid-binding Zn ribbon protein
VTSGAGVVRFSDEGNGHAARPCGICRRLFDRGNPEGTPSRRRRGAYPSLVSVEVERRCVQCGGALPEGSRADRRYCSSACRTAAYAERQRRARTRLLAEHEEPPDESARRLDLLREAVRDAVQEPKLVAVIAAEARHNWRASAWLLSRIHPTRWGERGRDVPLTFDDDPDDPFREVDELASRRRRKPDGY